MTLVVARIAAGRIAIASDTILTKQGSRLPLQEGLVKSCMLPGGICVSFANSPESAATEFRKFVEHYPNGVGFSEAVTFFEKSSGKTGNDYIVAFSRAPRIVKIADGQRIDGASNTQWIGDRSAYERFREYQAKQRGGVERGRAMNAVLFADEMPNSPASDLYSSMRHVVADATIQSTGGFVCIVSNRNEGFRHSVYSDMLYNWPAGEADEFVLNLEHPIDFGASDQNAGYAIAQISTAFIGLNLVAFYLLKPRKLFFYYSADYSLANKCLVFQNIDASEIAKTLNDVLGFDCHWLLTIVSAAEDRTSTTFRLPDASEKPQGIELTMRCHANTFPKTKP